jgi:hypothetical protein
MHGLPATATRWLSLAANEGVRSSGLVRRNGSRARDWVRRRNGVLHSVSYLEGFYVLASPAQPCGKGAHAIGTSPTRHPSGLKLGTVQPFTRAPAFGVNA